MSDRPDDVASREGTVFRAFVVDEFLEWPAWRRLQQILMANGGSYGISGPRGAGKSWLMLRAIHWAGTRPDGYRPAGIGLWYPSPSEYEPLAFLASLSDVLATEIERWYRHDDVLVRRRLRVRRRVELCAVAAGTVLVALAAALGATVVSPFVAVVGAIAGAAAIFLAAALAVRWWLESQPEHQLMRQALAVQERARFTATYRQSSELAAEAGRGVVGKAMAARSRELVERPATLSSLVNDFRALAQRAGTLTHGRVVIAIDELDKMADAEGVRKLLRDIKGIFEVPGVCFLVSVSDEAARNLSLGSLTERNEFSSSFYTVVQAQRPTPDQCAEMLDARGAVPREVGLALAVLAGGNPREVIRLGELVGPASTAAEAARLVLADEALTLRSEVVTALESPGLEPVGRDARVAVFRSLPDESFRDPVAFHELCGRALGELWDPVWADTGWRQRFEEGWSRLMVRLAVAGRLLEAKSLVRDKDGTDALLDVVVAAGQSAHVAQIVLDTNLRVARGVDRVGMESVARLREDFEALGRRYEEERGARAAGRERTQILDGIVRSARAQAGQLGLTAQEVDALLRSERSGDRVLGLAVVQVSGDPQTVDAVLKIAEKPPTPFEGYHALRALESLRPSLSGEASAKLQDMLNSMSWRQSLGRDSSRIELADRLRAALVRDTTTVSR